HQRPRRRERRRARRRRGGGERRAPRRDRRALLRRPIAVAAHRRRQHARRSGPPHAGRGAAHPAPADQEHRMKALSRLPRLSLSLAGSALDAAELEALDAVRIQERLSLPAQCELTFVDPPAAFSDRTLSAGAPVLLAIDAGDTLFEGEVIAVELVFTAARQREVRVRAYDKLHRLRRKQPVRALAQITIGDLASQLCAEVGLSAAAEEAGPEWPWIVQWRQTNLE